jgi:hypothetical protein
MIQFRNLLESGPVDFRKPIAIGAFDLGGDLIAVCRDVTDDELRKLKDSDFVKETGFLPKRKGETPYSWDCWEVVVTVPSDPEGNKTEAIQKMIASCWAISSGIQAILEPDQ